MSSAAAAFQVVEAGIAAQRVVSVAAIHCVIAAGAPEHVGALIAVDRVVAGITEETIVACAAVHNVGAIIAAHRVIAVSPCEDVRRPVADRSCRSDTAL